MLKLDTGAGAWASLDSPSLSSDPIRTAVKTALEATRSSSAELGVRVGHKGEGRD